jgi:hypothetical protein
MPQDICTNSNSVKVNALAALAWSRAWRFGQGELGLPEAVDFLQDWAATHGLVASVGQDAVQQIISTAFAELEPPHE